MSFFSNYLMVEENISVSSPDHAVSLPRQWELRDFSCVFMLFILQTLINIVIQHPSLRFYEEELRELGPLLSKSS